MNNLEMIEKFEQYYENMLQGEELIEFEKKLNTDPHLAEQFENYKIARQEIQNKGRSNLKMKLNDIHHQFIMKKEKRKVSSRYIISIAAALAGIALITTTLINSRVFKPKINKEVLFAKYFTPYPNMFNTRGDSDNITFLQKTAMYYYSTRQFDQAIVNFEELRKNTKTIGADVLFYNGICCMMTDQNQKAIQIFSQLSGNDKQTFFEQSNWYLALAYLKNNDLIKSNEVLRSIIKSKSSYDGKALDLLEKIK